MKHNIVPTSEYFVIDGMKFGQIIIEATTKLGADKCFPDFQDSFRHFVLTDEETDEIWTIFQPAIKSYKGDAENYFAACFKLLQPGKHLFKNLPVLLSTLLCSEIINLCLANLVAGNPEELAKGDESTIKFTEKDINCIQYLSGYCFRTIFKKIRRKKQWESDIAQQYLAELKAAKLDTTDDQSLLMSRDRGGLWAVCNKAIEIFKVCEKEFLVARKKSCHRIDCENIVSALVNNCYVTSNFDDICKSVDCLISKEISMNLLSIVILLYVRVRSYSLAKKIKERSKANTIKPTEKNSLLKTTSKW